MTLLKRSTLLLIIAVFILAAAGCNNKLALYINVKEGDSYKYHVVSETETEIEAEGQAMKTVQTMVSDYSVDVNSVDSNGDITMDYKYQTLKVDVDAAGVKQSYDSENPVEGDPLSGVYDGMIGKGFTVVMDKYGVIKEVGGIDELLNSIIDSIEGDGNDEELDALKEQLKGTLQQSFGDEAITSMLKPTTEIFPKEEKKVGDSWENSYDIKAIVEMNITTRYTLDKLEGDIAHISISGEFETQDSEGVNMLGIEMDTDLKGTMSGAIKINKNNGFLSEGEIEQLMEGKMSFEVPEQGKMEMPMKVTSKTSYSLTE